MERLTSTNSRCGDRLVPGTSLNASSFAVPALRMKSIPIPCDVPRWSGEAASQLREKHKAMLGIEEWDEYEIQKRTYEKMNGLSEGRLRRTFEAIDEDGSGLIEWGEFKRLMRRLAPATPDDEVVVSGTHPALSSSPWPPARCRLDSCIT